MDSSPYRPGLMDEIRCDEKDYLIWKWRPAGITRRENAIHWGSSLRVRDGSVAVFVYRRKGESAIEEFIEGPFDEILKTSNLPIIASFAAGAYGGGTPFPAEVYFINLAKAIQTRFAVRYFDVFDTRFPDIGVPVAVRGAITFHIADCRRFIELHRLDEFGIEDFRAQIKDAVSRRVKTILADMPMNLEIPLQQLAGRTDDLSELAQRALAPRLSETFGIEVASLDISAIDVDKESEGYQQLMRVSRDVAVATVRAQTEANVKNIHEMQRVQMENLQETLRIEREEGQYRIHKQTQSANLPSFQIEKQAEVGVAGAEALGRMGEHGSASVGLGGGGGMDMAGMAAGMAVGSAVGQNIANTLNGIMGGSPSVSGATLGISVPPPIPVERYHVVINGAAAGPFDLATLCGMATAGDLTPSSLVWKEGMADWAPVSSVAGLAVLFNSGGATPPPVPQQ